MVYKKNRIKYMMHDVVYTISEAKANKIILKKKKMKKEEKSYMRKI